MKKVFSSNEVAHIWARQSQDEGKTPTRNIYFNKTEIYSYGSHFCMAKILNDKTVLITNRTYSATTSGHLSGVRYAVNHMERISCKYPQSSVIDNVKDIKDTLHENFEILKRDNRTRPETKERAKIAIQSCIANSLRYFEVMGTDEKKVLKLAKEQIDSEYHIFIAYWNSAKTLDFEGLDKAKANISKQLEQAEKKKRARLLLEHKKDVARWMKGERVYISRSMDEVYLRLNEDTIETSMGAEVSVRQAKVLFEMIKQGKDIKGFDIDGYTVIGINGVLTIGCHKIERTEINRFAKLQGWGEIPLH